MPKSRRFSVFLRSGCQSPTLPQPLGGATLPSRHANVISRIPEGLPRRAAQERRRNIPGLEGISRILCKVRTARYCGSAIDRRQEYEVASRIANLASAETGG